MPTDDDKLDLPAGAWPAPEPPAGFAERVLAARRGELAARPPAPPARRPARAWALVALAAVATAGVIFFVSVERPAAHTGALTATERTEVSLHGRGVAVAERGAVLRWSVAPSGEATLVQDAGSVFYRVDKAPGEAFVVRTPVAEVIVTGTCFRLEVEAMNKMAVISGVGGAALAATLTVVVYEGKVRVKDAHGEREVAAGERLAVSGDGAGDDVGGAPIAARPDKERAELAAPPPDGATREDLIARDGKQREEIARLEGRLRLLEKERDRMQAQRQLGEPGKGDPREHKMSGFTPEEWAEMADRCEIRYELPPMRIAMMQSVPPKMAEEVGLSQEDANRALAAMKGVVEQHLKDLRALYVEATGDAEGADSLDPQALATEILEKAGGGSEARRRVALERAGQLQPPADGGSVAERYFRLVLRTGDLVESELTKVVGPERAKELHSKMSGNRSIMSGCGDEDEAEKEKAR
jgi:hypothetical protein